MSENKVSIGNGSWFNKVNQGDNNNGGSNISFWKTIGAVLAGLAAIATIIGVLLSLGIISVN